jgi:hypothetical protein
LQSDTQFHNTDILAIGVDQAHFFGSDPVINAIV